MRIRHIKLYTPYEDVVLQCDQLTKLLYAENGLPPLFASFSPSLSASLHVTLPTGSGRGVLTIDDCGEIVGEETVPADVLPVDELV